MCGTYPTAHIWFSLICFFARKAKDIDSLRIMWPRMRGSELRLTAVDRSMTKCVSIRFDAFSIIFPKIAFAVIEQACKGYSHVIPTLSYPNLT